MDQISIIVLVLSVFLILGLGAFLRRMKWLSVDADSSFLNLVVRVLMPCLFFRAVVGNENFMHLSDAWLPPTLGFGCATVGYLVALGYAKVGGKYFGLKTRGQILTFALCVGAFNATYIPLPLIEKMFGEQTLGTCIIYNLGVDVSLWTVGIMILHGKFDRSCFKRLLNPPVYAIGISLLINIMGWHDKIPDLIFNPINALSHAAIPLGLIMIGATMADQFESIRSELFVGWQTCLAGVAIRLTLLPVAFIVAARYLDIGLDLKRVLVVQAAMPSAIFPIVLASHYGGDPKVALRVVFATSIIAIFTIPYVIAQNMDFVMPVLEFLR